MFEENLTEETIEIQAEQTDGGPEPGPTPEVETDTETTPVEPEYDYSLYLFSHVPLNCEPEAFPEKFEVKATLLSDPTKVGFGPKEADAVKALQKSLI
jgi:hypothetical protein